MDLAEWIIDDTKEAKQHPSSSHYDQTIRIQLQTHSSVVRDKPLKCYFCLNPMIFGY